MYGRLLSLTFGEAPSDDLYSQRSHKYWRTACGSVTRTGLADWTSIGAAGSSSCWMESSSGWMVFGSRPCDCPATRWRTQSIWNEGCWGREGNSTCGKRTRVSTSLNWIEEDLAGATQPNGSLSREWDSGSGGVGWNSLEIDGKSRWHHPKVSSIVNTDLFIWQGSSRNSRVANGRSWSVFLSRGRASTGFSRICPAEFTLVNILQLWIQQDKSEPESDSELLANDKSLQKLLKWYKYRVSHHWKRKRQQQPCDSFRLRDHQRHESHLTDSLRLSDFKHWPSSRITVLPAKVLETDHMEFRIVMIS
jgi:hypothetical protein